MMSAGAGGAAGGGGGGEEGNKKRMVVVVVAAGHEASCNMSRSHGPLMTLVRLAAQRSFVEPYEPTRRLAHGRARGRPDSSPGSALRPASCSLEI